jgi:PadR family transcriptional regulator, regulatory protein PadR
VRITHETIRVLEVFIENINTPLYGLELARETGLKSGTLYPTLIRLERNEWLTAEWEDIDPKLEGRSPRRYYRMTEQGASQAKQVIRENKTKGFGRTVIANV